MCPEHTSPKNACRQGGGVVASSGGGGELPGLQSTLQSASLIPKWVGLVHLALIAHPMDVALGGQLSAAQSFVPSAVTPDE